MILPCVFGNYITFNDVKCNHLLRINTATARLQQRLNNEQVFLKDRIINFMHVVLCDSLLEGFFGGMLLYISHFS